MKINILAFGQIAGVTGSKLVLQEEVHDTETLKTALLTRYPALREMRYSIAVDKKMVHDNTPLTDDVTIALLPPFSGG